jgi:hypothetical protein
VRQFPEIFPNHAFWIGLLYAAMDAYDMVLARFTGRNQYVAI